MLGQPWFGQEWQQVVAGGGVAQVGQSLDERLAPGPRLDVVRFGRGNERNRHTIPTLTPLLS